MKQQPNYPFLVFYLFSGCVLILATIAFGKNTTTAMSVPVPVNVGVVMDMSSWVGKMGLSCINMSLSDFYDSHPHYNTRIVLHPRDSMNDVVGAAAAALDLIKNNNVQAIIGPKTSMQANFIIELGEKSHVPIITFTATSPTLTSLRSPYFFRVAQNDSSQVSAISAIVKHFGWRHVVPIYEDDEFGEGILPYLIDALQDVNAQVPYRSVINPSASGDQIGEELYKLMTMQTRVFVVHMNHDLSSEVFKKAKEIGMMSEGYVWILTDATSNLLESMDSSILNSMQGALGIKTYVPRSNELKSFKTRWIRKLLQDNVVLNEPQLDVFGLWAYDAASALALAIEKTGALNFTSRNFTNPLNNVTVTDLQALEVSENGHKIRDSLLETKFKGLSGEFSLVNGQLKSTNFQIVNVNSNGGNVVGLWTPENETVELKSIIWPGDSTKVPKGWEIPTNGKILRIGVPVKNGYSEFVKVNKNGSVEGYCIDVFNEVVAALPYALPHEFIPFALPNGSSAGSYDDLVYQIFDGKVDAVVGDVTIVSNRSLYVDFSLPFTESGVSMVVPIKNNSKNKAWVFLKPLTLDLWVTSFCFFVFMGFVVWVLEHRINDDFRGPPSHQIGTSLWFSFCTMVFAQRETLVSNLARFVVVIWFFVVLILTQSYTASLTSLLTVQQLQPTVTDVNLIIKNKMSVGFQEGSFVYGLLKNFGIQNLKSFESPEELDELFRRGIIDAAFDEIPYIKLFFSKFPNKYTMTDPNYKTDGFGFAFPKGSPLVGDISRAVLNVTESYEVVKRIEKEWFGDQNNSPSSSSEVNFSRLNLSSFWGLFLIAGSAAVLSLILYFIIFLYKEKHSLNGVQSHASIWKKLGVLLKIYDAKDLTSHTFRKSPLSGLPVEASPAPSTNYPLSPSMDSVQDQSFEFSNDFGDLSPENRGSSPEIVNDTVNELDHRNREGEVRNGEEIIQVIVKN